MLRIHSDRTTGDRPIHRFPETRRTALGLAFREVVFPPAVPDLRARGAS